MPKGDTLERHNYETRKLYDKKFRSNWRFRGVDGEGGNVPEEGTLFGVRHQYLSLRIGPYLLDTGHPLDYKACFNFICDQPSQGFIYVAYFFDYDVTMMIRTLPEKVARALLNRHLRFAGDDNRTSFPRPIKYDGFEFDYLPHKEFKIRRIGQKHFVTISDVGQFFQSSFLTTLERWNIGTEEEREIIAYGKSQRSHFEHVTEEVNAYNALEVDLLEQLMTNFRAVCEETGYVPKKWQGPGYLASAMLERHGVPRRDRVPILSNESFYNLALAAYYGGRFETTAAGNIQGPIYQYDINSAYPSICRTLPCLLHGSWVSVKDQPTEGLWFGKIKYNHDAPRHLYNLPFRNKQGNISYPKAGIGVYWSTEIAAAEAAGTKTQFLEGWLYQSHCDCRWFDFVEPYYRQRLALGKSNKGYVLKLAGNSVYGKIAQSVGYAPYANPVWAGLITAGCRAQLISAYSQNEGKCYMLATDGLFMGCQLDLPISTALGDWEETVHPDGMFIVQPGIYFIGDTAKTRGVERGRIYGLRQDFEAKFEKFYWTHGIDHVVEVPVVNFITAKQALMRNKWGNAGTWEETNREISFDWSIKRKSGIAFTEDEGVRTLPHNGDENAESVPYARAIGRNLHIAPQDRWVSEGLKEAERIEEQPDWVQPLL
jgi:hypothetical protein